MSSRRTTFFTNVQKNLVTESGWEVASADAVAPSWTHSWNTLKTCNNAEAAREHCACVHAAVFGMKLADPGITTEPRGAQLRIPGRLIFSLPLLPPHVAPPCTCAWPPLVLRQLAEMQGRRHSIVNFCMTGMKSEN